MSPPRTLHLTNAYHAASGGIRTLYRALLAAASLQQREMRLVVPAERARVERLDRWTTIHHVAARRAPCFDRRYRLLRPDHYWSRRTPVGVLLAAMRPDVVEVCDKYTLAPLGRLVRAGRYSFGPRPTVVGLSCERMDDNVAAYVSPRRGARAAAHAYLRHVYAPGFDAHIANSAYTAAELREAGGLAAVTVCGMGVDADVFSAARPSAERRLSLLRAAGGSPASVLALYAGRLSPEKHLDVLVEAVGLLAHAPGGADARLVLAGEGPHTPALTALAARVAPGRVHVIGNICDRATLAELYASADVFVHPNPREPFGIGPLEAMAAGVPVVVADTGGVLSYAGAHNAWLSGPHPAALAAAMVAAAAGRVSDRIMRARATAQAFAWPVMAQRYFATLDDLHARRLRGAAAVPVGATATASQG